MALVAMLFSANAALAASVPLGAASGEGSCPAIPTDYIQLASVGNTFVVPAPGGTITSWSILTASADTGPVGLEVWRPATASTYTLVGSTTPVLLAPNSFNTNLPASIAVTGGDLLGLRLEGAATCGHFTGAAGDRYGFWPRAASAPPVGNSFLIVPGFQLDVSVWLDTTITPPPPPTSGCDATGQSNGNDDCQQTQGRNQN